MKLSFIHFKLILFVLSSMFLISCRQAQVKKKEVQVPYYNTPDFTPLWPTDNKAVDTLHRIAPFHFTDQAGKPVSESTFRGKIYLTNFFFTSCTSICPTMTENMKVVYDSFRNNPEVMFLSHSVDPGTDDVPKLAAYARAKGITGNQWRLVTGDVNEIYSIARKSYFVEEYMGLTKDASEFLHTEKFILVDRQGHLRGLYNGTLRTERARIIADIHWLLKE